MKHIKPFPDFTREERMDLALKIRAAVAYRAPPTWTGDPAQKPEWMNHPCMIHLGKWEDGKGFHKIKFKGHTLYVHRAMWVLEKGEDVPAGHVLDHLCRTRRCCNPKHLDPVTTRVNTERGNGAWIYGQGKASMTCGEILAASIEHGDPRVTYHGAEIPVSNFAVTGRYSHLTMNPPTPIKMPMNPDGAEKDILVHGVSQPSIFPRRLKLFFEGFLNRLAGVP